MKLDHRFLVVALSGLLFGSLDAAADLVEIGKARGQVFKGWGEVLSSDELAVTGRSFTKKSLVFTGLKPEIVFFGIHGDWYESGRDDGTLASANVERGLFPKLKMMLDSGAKVYATYEDSIPTGFTRYGKVNSFDRQVEHRRQADHVAYLLKLFEMVRKAGFPLPVAHSVQVPVEVSMIRAEGFSAEGDDWRTDGLLLAEQFKERFGSKLRVIGPDAQSVHETVVRVTRQEFAKAAGGFRDAFPPDFEFGFSNPGSEIPGTDRFGQFRQLIADSSTAGRDIWMTGWFAPEAKTEQEACIQAAQRIAGEVTKFRVNYWIWGYGYCMDYSSHTLVYKDGETTRLFGLFQTLWGEVRPGFVVHSVSFDDPELGIPSGYADANGIAFENGGKTVLLLVNPTGKDKTATLGTGEAVTANAWRFGDKPESTETKPPIAAHQVHLSLPAVSVTVVELSGPGP